MQFGDRPETKYKLSRTSRGPPAGTVGPPDESDTLPQEFGGPLATRKVLWENVKKNGVFFFPATLQPLGGAGGWRESGRGVLGAGGHPLPRSSLAWVSELGSQNQEKRNKFPGQNEWESMEVP